MRAVAQTSREEDTTQAAPMQRRPSQRYRQLGLRNELAGLLNVIPNASATPG